MPLLLTGADEYFQGTQQAFTRLKSATDTPVLKPVQSLQ